MFITNTAFLLSILTGTSALADVTPAHLVFTKVQAFLQNEAAEIINEKIEASNVRVYPVEHHMSLTRGKFSAVTGGSAQYFGTIDQVFTGAPSSDLTVESIHCRLFANAKVVPFAKQPASVEILETEVNHQQLIIDKLQIRCNLS